jgi:hypothetical protein
MARETDCEHARHAYHREILKVAELIRPNTTCKLCGQKFLPKRMLAVPIIGAPPEQAVQDFVMGLLKHLQVKHSGPKDTPPAVPALQAASQEFFGYMTLKHFDTEDPALKEMGDRVRYRIMLATRYITISDEAIAEQVRRAGEKSDNEYGPPLIEADTVFRLMVQLRDALLEQGPFMPDWFKRDVEARKIAENGTAGAAIQP